MKTYRKQKRAKRKKTRIIFRLSEPYWGSMACSECVYSGTYYSLILLQNIDLFLCKKSLYLKDANNPHGASPLEFSTIKEVQAEAFRMGKLIGWKRPIGYRLKD